MERPWARPVDERGTTEQKQRWEIAEGSAVNEGHAIMTLCFRESSRAQGITGLCNDGILGVIKLGIAITKATPVDVKSGGDCRFF